MLASSNTVPVTSPWSRVTSPLFFSQGKKANESFYLLSGIDILSGHIGVLLHQERSSNTSTKYSC